MTRMISCDTITNDIGGTASVAVERSSVRESSLTYTGRDEVRTLERSPCVGLPNVADGRRVPHHLFRLLAAAKHTRRVIAEEREAVILDPQR